LRLIYGLLTALVIYDLARHVILIIKLTKGWEPDPNKPYFKQIIGIFLQHLLLPTLFLLVFVVMIVSAGFNAARVTFYYQIIDLTLWLILSSIFSIIEAVIKFRWLRVSDTPNTSQG
jgi:hypothetical protein